MRLATFNSYLDVVQTSTDDSPVADCLRSSLVLMLTKNLAKLGRNGPGKYVEKHALTRRFAKIKTHRKIDHSELEAMLSTLSQSVPTVQADASSNASTEQYTTSGSVVQETDRASARSFISDKITLELAYNLLAMAESTRRPRARRLAVPQRDCQVSTAFN